MGGAARSPLWRWRSPAGGPRGRGRASDGAAALLVAGPCPGRKGDAPVVRAPDVAARGGGSGAVATELGLELGRRGHEVHLISYASPFRLRGYTERVFFHEVDVSGGNYPLFKFYPYTLALAAKQHEVALHERLDIMHVHYAIPHATTAYLAKQMLKGVRDLRVITTLHGTDITLVGQEHSFFSITKFSIEQSDAVTAVSEFLRDETFKAFGCEG